jgi:hypothetical protein
VLLLLLLLLLRTLACRPGGMLLLLLLDVATNRQGRLQQLQLRALLVHALAYKQGGSWLCVLLLLLLLLHGSTACMPDCAWCS